jgi:hypothetical protein
MKPELTLIPGNPTIDDIVAMFERLTGRKPTPEDRAEAEKLLASAKPKSTKQAPLTSNPRFREGPKGTGVMIIGAPRPK